MDTRSQADGLQASSSFYPVIPFVLRG